MRPDAVTQLAPRDPPGSRGNAAAWLDALRGENLADEKSYKVLRADGTPDTMLDLPAFRTVRLPRAPPDR